MNPVISIIIPCSVNHDGARRCIQSIRGKSQLRHEIILVENGMKRSLCDLVEQTIQYDHAIGFPKAINAGLQEARGDYICLMNDDVEIETPDWDRKLIQAMEKNGGWIISPITDFVANKYQHNSTYEDRGYREIIDAPYLHFVCVIFPRSTFDQVGLLDERFSPGNSEDLDYCIRIRRAGGKMLVDPNVFVHHGGHKTFGELKNGQFGDLLTKNLNKLMRKWRLNVRPSGETSGIQETNLERAEVFESI